ncbi:MAG: methionyl-tRNA formyltransferase [Cryomorphaceae bacterium]|nr:MAG: methionyl-tRNA formyltransferase [Cryomorphaceae bacterium]
MKQLRIVFMGTPEFAVASLDAIYNSFHNVVGVVTAPDKPAGRGKKISQSAVKEYALQQDLPLLQPPKLKDPEFLDELKALEADLFVVVAFRMLPEAVWSMPPLGTINLHASLLPAYRGAAPINWAIINGEKITGVTTFFINQQIDTGDIIDQREVPVSEDMNAGDLHDVLKDIGSVLLVATLDKIAQKKAVRRKQLSAEASEKPPEAPKLTRDNCRIQWDRPADEVIRFIKGLSPYPGAYTIHQTDGASFKILDATTGQQQLAPGEIAVSGKTLEVGTGSGSIAVLSLQAPGKRRMTTREYLNGVPQDYLTHFQ